MRFAKIIFIAVAITTNISWAQQEQVFYNCSADDSSLAFSLQFNRDQDWDASWDWDGDWDNQECPSYSSKVIIKLPEKEDEGSVEGKFLGGHTRLTGYSSISVASNDSSLILNLVENPERSRAFGHGMYASEGLFLSCTVNTETGITIAP